MRSIRALTALMSFVGVCLGCDDPGRMRPSDVLSLMSVAPGAGSSFGGTKARLTGTGFAGAFTLTVGGTPVAQYARVSSTAIELTMPPHSAGVADIVLTSLASANEVVRLAGAFSYIDYPPPVVSDVSPSRVSTEGSVLYIKGTGFTAVTTVTIDGRRVSAFHHEGTLFTSAPPHAEGVVDVVVTNADGQTVRVSGGLSYARPESFDFNGNWEGGADNGAHDGTVIRFTIEDSVMISLSCGGADVLPEKAPTVALGRIASMDGRITGRITSEGQAEGQITIAPCGSHSWGATKK